VALSPNDKATCFNKQFINTTIHSTNQQNRLTDRKVKKLPKTTYEINTTQTTESIKHSKNNNSTGPDGINIKHLKHLGPIAITYLTKLFNIALNQNIIPAVWKLAKIVPISKPNKDPGVGASYRPISLLSPISKLLEKIILPTITTNIPKIEHQHGFKPHHSTTTALHNLTNQIVTGFNNKKPPKRTIAFDTINLHTVIHKLTNTNIPNTIIKFISNYIKGRKAYTTYNNAHSKQQQFKAGVPQGGVLPPPLQHIHVRHTYTTT
jgi:hypothetical protein